MKLFEIDTGGVLTVEFECDAPRSIDMNGVTGRIEAMQGMKIKPWQVHILRALRRFETVQPTRMRLCIFASIFPVFPVSNKAARTLFLKDLIMGYVSILLTRRQAV